MHRRPLALRALFAATLLTTASAPASAQTSTFGGFVGTVRNFLMAGCTPSAVNNVSGANTPAVCVRGEMALGQGAAGGWKLLLRWNDFSPNPNVLSWFHGGRPTRNEIDRITYTFDGCSAACQFQSDVLQGADPGLGFSNAAVATRLTERVAEAGVTTLANFEVTGIQLWYGVRERLPGAPYPLAMLGYQPVTPVFSEVGSSFVIPEPSTLALAAAGIVGLGAAAGSRGRRTRA